MVAARSVNMFGQNRPLVFTLCIGVHVVNSSRWGFFSRVNEFMSPVFNRDHERWRPCSRELYISWWGVGDFSLRPFNFCPP